MELFQGLGINWKILVGQGINFLILLFLMEKFVYPRFFSILKERKEKIEEGIKRMEEAERKIKMAKAEKEQILKEAKENAKLIVQEAQELAKAKESEILAKAEREREKIIEEAKKIGQEEIKKLKEDFLRESLQISFLLAEKILAKKIDEKEDKKLIMEFLNQIKDYEKRN
jgi:F-type H+-transporting ATPase subunit b